MRHLGAGFLWVLLLLGSGVSHGQDLSWPTFRHDQDRTGRSEGIGDITDPVVKWTYDLGGQIGPYEVWIGNLTGDAQKEFAFVESGRVIVKNAQELVLWTSDPIGATQIVGAFDFDGDGTIELLVSSNGPPAALTILERDTGDVLWRLDDFGTGATTLPAHQILVADTTGDGLPEIVCSARINDEPTHAFSFSSGFLSEPSLNEIWSYSNTAYVYDIPYVAGDVDNDDVIEVVFLENRQITILDGITGLLDHAATETFLTYSFGLLQIVNVDTDPQPEVVAIASSRHHYAITVFDEVDGAVSWQYQWSPPDWRDLTFVDESVVDLDMDGSMEIVVSVFNDTDDEYTVNTSSPADHDGVNRPDRWTLLVLDASTGSVETALPDAVLTGILRTTPLSTPIILTQSLTTSTPVIPQVGTIQAHEFSGGSLSPVWTLSNAALAYRPGPPHTDRNTMGNSRLLALQDLNGDELDDIYIHRELDGDTLLDALQVFSLESGEPVLLHQYDLAEFESSIVLSIGDGLSSATSNTESALFLTTGLLQVLDADFVSAASAEAGRFTTSPFVGDITADGANDIVATMSTDVLQVLETISGGPTLDWSYYGGSIEPTLTLIDVDGDTVQEVVVRNTGDKENPYIALLDTAGAESWTSTLWGFGSSPSLVIGTTIDSDSYLDLAVLATDVREPSSADVRLVGISGDSGSQFWNVPTAENQTVLTAMHSLECGSPPSECIMAIAAQAIEQYRASDGALVDSDPYYRLARASSIADFDGDGNDELLLASREDTDGIQIREIGADSPSSVIPFDYDTQLYYRFHAIYSDTPTTNGFIQPFPEGKIVAYSGDGTILWGPIWPRAGVLLGTDPGDNIDIPYVSVADIDGDTVEDALTGTGEGYLYAIRTTDASLLWSVPLYASVHEPILADVDGDDLLEVLVVTGDGRINLIDQESLMPVDLLRDVALDRDLVLVDPDTDIDESETRIALGASWEPAIGASGYRMTAIDQDDIQLTPWVDVGNVTSYVLNTAPLLLDETYRVVVVTYDSSGTVSAETRSDGLMIVDSSDPVIERFEAVPAAFNPGLERTRLEIEAWDWTWIASWDISLLNDASVEVMDWSGEPNSRELDFTQFWDGTDAGGGSLPDGTYSAVLTITDLADHQTTAEIEIELDRTLIPSDEVPEPIEDSSTDPDVEADLSDEDVEDDWSDYKARGGGCACAFAF